jgi:sugar phosphate isomerase/epimerase
MKIGVCAPIDKAAIAMDAGADYIELNCSATLQPYLTDAEWAPMRSRLLNLPLPVMAFNVFYNSGKLIGPDANLEQLVRYANRAATRAREIGAGIIVIGSGAARSAPPDISQARAMSQFRRFLEACADAGERNGVKFCIEHLNRHETNLINSVSAAAELVRVIHSPYLRLLIDSYHMDVEREPMRAIVESHGLISHVHTADSDRVPPGQGEYDHVRLRQTLRIGGYSERISIECNWQDFDAEIEPAIRHLRAAMN